MLQNTVISARFEDPATFDAGLSARIRGLEGSMILRIAGEIRKMLAEGRTVCNLTVGDFDSRYFPIPAALADRIRAALDAGQTNYPPPDGMPSLRQAVADHTARAWGVRYPIESVLIASGARPAIYAAFHAVLDPGDKVVFPVPSWNNPYFCYLAQAQAVALPTRPERHFMPTVEDLAPHLHDARLLVLNTPSNPTGTVMEPDVLEKIARAVVDENRRRETDGERPLFLLIDMVYASLVFRGAVHVHPVLRVPEAAPYVVGIDAVSKAFAATGLRVGWATAAPPLIRRMKDLIGHVGAWAPKPEQVALAGFLQDPAAVDAFTEAMLGRVQQRLDALYDGVLAMRGDGLPVDAIHPQGAIYLSLRLDWIGRRLDGRVLDDNEAIRSALLAEAGLAVVPFQAFGLEGDDGWFRISVGAVSTEEIADALPRLRALTERIR